MLKGIICVTLWVESPLNFHVKFVRFSNQGHAIGATWTIFVGPCKKALDTLLGQTEAPTFYVLRNCTLSLLVRMMPDPRHNGHYTEDQLPLHFVLQECAGGSR